MSTLNQEVACFLVARRSNGCPKSTQTRSTTSYCEAHTLVAKLQANCSSTDGSKVQDALGSECCVRSAALKSQLRYFTTAASLTTLKFNSNSNFNSSSGTVTSELKADVMTVLLVPEQAHLETLDHTAMPSAVPRTRPPVASSACIIALGPGFASTRLAY